MISPAHAARPRLRLTRRGCLVVDVLLAAAFAVGLRVAVTAVLSIPTTPVVAP